MLADQLIARAQRCAELNAMLGAEPAHKKAPGWITEIAKNALTRREERHVAIVRTVRRIRGRIAALEEMDGGQAQLVKHRDALVKRVKAMPSDEKGYQRFSKKLADLNVRIDANDVESKKALLPKLRARLDALCSSDELLTREDVIHG